MGIKKILSLLATTLLLSVTFVPPVFAAPVDIPAPNVQDIWNHVQDMINSQESALSPAPPESDNPVVTSPAPVPAKDPAPEKLPEPQPKAELQPAPEPAPNPAPAQRPVPRRETPAGEQFSQFQLRVVELVNMERQKEGLHPLVADTLLMKGASAKSQDMVENQYFSHNSPKYGSPFDMMRAFGISYRNAGENIASGQTSPEAVVRAWMESPGHRANIMSSKFNKIGVGYAYTGAGSYHHFWTQWFTN